MTTDELAYKTLEGLGAAPLWRFYGNLFPAQPKSRAVPYRWSWQELRPHLLHFSESLSLDEAERRVLMLVNPGLTDPPATVNTLYAGLQIILPGETAQAHRHTSNAFRFVLEGGGAWTTVNGERVFMSPGDLLLTPGWHWHDHTHEGDAPMMWLDALDYPLVNALEAGFYEQYHQRLQPVTRPDDAGSRQFLHGRLNPVWLSQDGPGSPSRGTRGRRRSGRWRASPTPLTAAMSTASSSSTPTRGQGARSCPRSAAASSGCAPGSRERAAGTRPPRSSAWCAVRASRSSTAYGWSGPSATRSPFRAGLPTGI